MMKNLVCFVFTIVCLQACSIFSALTSTTTIDPNKSFVLGQGKHGSYSAAVKNVGNDLIEVIQVDSEGAKSTLGVLKVGEKKSYQVLANHTILFKNVNTQKQGVIEIFAKGDTNLSMGYQENR
jgi:hypothetical protein